MRVLFYGPPALELQCGLLRPGLSCAPRLTELLSAMAHTIALDASLLPAASLLLLLLLPLSRLATMPAIACSPNSCKAQCEHTTPLPVMCMGEGWRQQRLDATSCCIRQ